MKFLALSDAHGVYSHIAQLLFKAGDVDAVLRNRDITDFGPNALVQELLSLIGEDVPTLMVPGTVTSLRSLKRLRNLPRSTYI